MAKKWLSLTACLLLGGAAWTQKLDNSLLWKISGNGLSEPSYVYGTVHITCNTDLDERVIKAMDDTKQLYLEIDMDDPSLQMQMGQAMLMKDGSTLRKILPKDAQEKLDALLIERVGMGLEIFNLFQPQAISMMLTPTLLDCEAPGAVENSLMSLTKEQNEEVYGLESVETQLKALSVTPIHEQAEDLVIALNEGIDNMKAELDHMNALYAKQDIEGLYKYTTEHDSMQNQDAVFALLQERNTNWIPVIEKAAKETPTFFGVGAAHLAGEHGVIRLLRKAGYKVEAVK